MAWGAHQKSYARPGKVKSSVEETEQQRLVKETERETLLAAWAPKTKLGKMVKNGEIESLDQVFERNEKIMEPEIIDMLVPQLMEKLVDFKKTARVKRAGRQFSFRVSILVGDGNRYIGLGMAKDKERWLAIKKAAKKARLNLVMVRKGCGSWECACGTSHSLPFKVSGSCASAKVTLIPAPKGLGLVVGDNIKDVMRFAGIRDAWSKSKGNTSTKLNFVAAAVNALAQTMKMRISNDIGKKIGKG